MTENIGRTLPHFGNCEDKGNDFRTWVGQRGDRLQRCNTCGCISVAALEPRHVKPRGAEPGQRWLACVRCPGGKWVNGSKARVPLCANCERPAS